MQLSLPQVQSRKRLVRWLPLFAALLLTACELEYQEGNAVDDSASDSTTPGLATAATTLDLDVAELPDTEVQPSFHVAPVVLDEPDSQDEINNDSSIYSGPHKQSVPSELGEVDSSRLTVESIEAVRRFGWRPRARSADADSTIQPMAAGSVVSTYTPAQIRSAYGLPTLPVVGAAVTAAQAAQLGAGQTIYIVNAMHNPNVVAELTAFNQKFGLPTCASKAIATNAALPLTAAAPAAGCTLSVVYTTPGGAMTAKVPAYESGWATEIALDVQWAHATAPLARIILIEAPDASVNSLVGAVKMANSMGPGIVSMSFGAVEGNWTASVDSAFSRSDMTYLAATGDSGASVAWPSVSSNVVAVGGTTLTYAGMGNRSETGWSGTGGGVSSYTSTPSYQAAYVPGVGSLARRSVADVAFNADPSSGQYVAVISPGSAAVKWISAGGTSLATPQWAGVFAIANAMRAQTAKPALGASHAVLYGQVAGNAASYATAFSDITRGANGSCSICQGRVGYDAMTGLGTPNVNTLVSALSGISIAAVPPVVTSASISGKVGTALTFTVSVNAPNAVTYSLSGAPSGMSISGSGVVSWAKPVVGSYSVAVTAKDSKTGLSGQGLYTVKIDAIPPTVSSGNISGKAGTALKFNVKVTSANPASLSLGGAPTGMSISSAGVVSWAKPVTGSYKVTVTAKDSKNGLSGQGIYSIAISAPQPPQVASAIVNGKPGVALTYSPTVSASGPVTYSLGGAPAGLTINSSGKISWAKPVAGNYIVTVIAKDKASNLSGQGILTLTIVQAGPVITLPVMNGVVGKSMSGTIGISAPGARAVSITLTGLPLGMMLYSNGMNITLTWPKPVLGTYNINVSVIDSTGLAAKATLTVKVAAK